MKAKNCVFYHNFFCVKRICFKSKFSCIQPTQNKRMYRIFSCCGMSGNATVFCECRYKSSLKQSTALCRRLLYPFTAYKFMMVSFLWWCIKGDVFVMERGRGIIWKYLYWFTPFHFSVINAIVVRHNGCVGDVCLQWNTLLPCLVICLIYLLPLHVYWVKSRVLMWRSRVDGKVQTS